MKVTVTSFCNYSNCLRSYQKHIEAKNIKLFQLTARYNLAECVRETLYSMLAIWPFFLVLSCSVTPKICGENIQTRYTILNCPDVLVFDFINLHMLWPLLHWWACGSWPSCFNLDLPYQEFSTRLPYFSIIFILYHENK